MACIFCQIGAGQSKSKKIYEDGRVIAILDVFPVTEGHTLVIPKHHFKSIYDLPDDEAGHLFNIARRMGLVLQKSLKADAINISTAPAAIDHFHIHVVPRYDYDMMGALPDLDNKREMSPKRMELIHKKILDYLKSKEERTYKVEVEKEKITKA